MPASTNLFTTALDPVECDLMLLLWNCGPQTTRQLLTALRNGRPMAYLTMTEALERLCKRGMLNRHKEPCFLTGATWRYSPTFTRQALLLQAVEQLCRTLSATNADREQMAAAVRHGNLGIS